MRRSWLKWSLLGWLLSCAAVCGLARDAEIAAAIERLGGKSHQVREQASAYLWARGEAAVEALAAAAKRDDPEVSLRAGEILDKIRSGILPGMDPGLSELVRAYRAGTREQKENTLREILRTTTNRVTIVGSLLAGESPGDRQVLVGMIGGELHRLAGEATVAGELDAAQDFLRLGAAAAGATRCMHALLVTAIVRGNLDREIELWASREDVKTVPVARVLTYLYRASGEMDRALLAAADAGDPLLKQALVRESGDWAGLVKMLEATPQAGNVEWMGFHAAALRLAGDTNGFEKTVKDLQALAGNEPTKSWVVAEALLVNDRFDDAVEVLLKGERYASVARLYFMHMRVDDLRKLASLVEAEKRPEEEIKKVKEILGLISARDAKLEQEGPAEEPEPPDAQTRLALLANAAREKPDDALAQYLYGRALAQSGKRAEGEEVMKRATLIPLDDNMKRWELIAELVKQGAYGEAAAQRDLILRAGRLESWPRSQALRTFGDGLPLKDEELSRLIACREQSRLLLLRENTAMVDIGGYLMVGWRLAYWKARYHLSQGRVDEALDAAERAHRLLPSEIDVPLWVCEAFKGKERERAVARIVKPCMAVLEKACADLPERGVVRNQLAWLSARCRVELKLGLKVAEEAVKLAPENAAYLDTLAEVEFQLGNQKRALELMHRCIELEPKTEYFKRQLKRFKAGDPTTDPEE